MARSVCTNIEIQISENLGFIPVCSVSVAEKIVENVNLIISLTKITSKFEYFSFNPCEANNVNENILYNKYFIKPLSNWSIMRDLNLEPPVILKHKSEFFCFENCHPFKIQWVVPTKCSLFFYILLLNG